MTYNSHRDFKWNVSALDIQVSWTFLRNELFQLSRVPSRVVQIIFDSQPLIVFNEVSIIFYELIQPKVKNASFLKWCGYIHSNNILYAAYTWYVDYTCYAKL